jgi:hypothetical protein
MVDENKDTSTPAVRLATADSGISATPEPAAKTEAGLKPLLEPQETQPVAYPSALEAGSSSDDVS